jgi:hypothetical protein
MSTMESTWFKSRGLRPSNHLGLTRARTEDTTCLALLRAILSKLLRCVSIGEDGRSGRHTEGGVEVEVAMLTDASNAWMLFEFRKGADPSKKSETRFDPVSIGTVGTPKH